MASSTAADNRLKGSQKRKLLLYLFFDKFLQWTIRSVLSKSDNLQTTMYRPTHFKE